MAAPRSDGDHEMAYWRGTIDTQLRDIQSSVNRINADMEHIKEDIVESNIKIAGYVKVFAVVMALFTILAPFLIKLIFGIKT